MRATGVQFRKTEVFDIFSSVADCAGLIGRCHIAFKPEAHPRLDYPMGYQGGDVSFSISSDSQVDLAYKSISVLQAKVRVHCSYVIQTR